MMEPDWLKYLDEDRQEELRETNIYSGLGPDLIIPGYHKVNPQVELLIQIIKELRKK